MNKRTQNKKKRDEKLFSDFRELVFKHEIQINAVYARLANKYNIDQGTVARAVYRERKKLRDADDLAFPP